jgi:hypothetical protein
MVSKIAACGAFQHLFAEPLAGQVTRCARPGAPPGNDAARPLTLRLQGRHGLLDEVGSHAALLEVVPDCRVSIAPPCERFGPILGEPRVVDEPGGAQDGERLFGRARADGPLLQAQRELPGREVACP